MKVALDSTATNATHMLFVGDGWVEATAVYLDMPDPEVDGAEPGTGWHFHRVEDLLRWLRS